MAKKMLQNALVKDVQRNMTLQALNNWSGSKFGLLPAMQKDSVLRKGKPKNQKSVIVQKAQDLPMTAIRE